MKSGLTHEEYLEYQALWDKFHRTPTDKTMTVQEGNERMTAFESAVITVVTLGRLRIPYAPAKSSGL